MRPDPRAAKMDCRPTSIVITNLIQGQPRPATILSGELCSAHRPLGKDLKAVWPKQVHAQRSSVACAGQRKKQTQRSDTARPSQLSGTQQLLHWIEMRVK